VKERMKYEMHSKLASKEVEVLKDQISKLSENELKIQQLEE
jgi:hypothetical protein